MFGFIGLEKKGKCLNHQSSICVILHNINQGLKKYFSMSPSTLFVALLKLKADVIKDMFQQDIAHRTCPRTLCGLEKGFKRNSMFFFK